MTTNSKVQETYKGANIKYNPFAKGYKWSYWYNDEHVITSCRTEEEMKFYIELEYQERQDKLAKTLKGK